MASLLKIYMEWNNIVFPYAFFHRLIVIKYQLSQWHCNAGSRYDVIKIHKNLMPNTVLEIQFLF